jgi:phosphate transport system protein
VRREIESVESKLLAQGALVEGLVDQAVEALLRGDRDLARSAVARDEEIDRAEVAIEERCLGLLLNRRPRAKSMRFLAAAMKVNASLERMADLAVNIAEAAEALAGDGGGARDLDPEPLADLAQQMVRESIDAFVTRDPALARRVRARDAEADALFEELRRKAVEIMKADPRRIEPMTAVLGSLANLERIADHATNVAEDVVYLVEGEIVRHRHEGSADQRS